MFQLNSISISPVRGLLFFCTAIVSTTGASSVEAEDLWINHNPYAIEASLVPGSILKLHIDEAVQIEYQYGNLGDEATSVKMVPDKAITDFLPGVSVERSINQKHKKDLRSRGRIKLPMAIRVTQIHNDGSVDFTGRKLVAHENGDTRLDVRVTGSVNRADIGIDRSISSAAVADLTLQITGFPVEKNLGLPMKQIPSTDPDKPGTTPSAKLTEEEKQQILLDYLNRVLGESRDL